MESMAKVTLKDVAMACGVSLTTVSLVVNGRAEGRLSPATMERVRAMASRLGYRPNLAARGLRSGQTRALALLADRVGSTPFAGALLAGAQHAAWSRRYVLITVDTGDDAELEQPAADLLLQQGAEGLVYGSMYHREVVLPQLPTDVAVAVANGFVASTTNWPTTPDCVVPDDEGAAFEAVSRLARAGHKRIGICLVNQPMPAVALRLEGYRRALREHDLEEDTALVVMAENNTTVAAVPVVTDLLQRHRPSAMFCFSDRIAMGAYQACSRLNLSIPGDLSIVGFDDHPLLADSLDPPLTTMALPHAAMGAWAVHRVIDRIEGDREPGLANPYRMPCPMEERSSVRTLSSLLFTEV